MCRSDILGKKKVIPLAGDRSDWDDQESSGGRSQSSPIKIPVDLKLGYERFKFKDSGDDLDAALSYEETEFFPFDDLNDLTDESARSEAKGFESDLQYFDSPHLLSGREVEIGQLTREASRLKAVTYTYNKALRTQKNLCYSDEGYSFFRRKQVVATAEPVEPSACDPELRKAIKKRLEAKKVLPSLKDECCVLEDKVACYKTRLKEICNKDGLFSKKERERIKAKIGELQAEINTLKRTMDYVRFGV